MRTFIYSTFSVLICIFNYSVTFSQDITFGRSLEIKSIVLGEARNINVWLPESYDSDSDKKYPVLYVFDGHQDFFTSASTVQYFSLRGFMPETIVVAIDNSQNRDRDLTPSSSNYAPTGGGADNFHQFLTTELIPEIDDSFKTNSYKTILGASYGGLYVLYELFNYKDFFDAYISISPSVFHDNGLIFEKALAYCDNPASSNKFLFLSLADERFQEMRMVFHNLVNLLRDRSMENLKIVVKDYPNETHETTRLVGLNDALRNQHQHWFIPFYQRDRGLNGLKEHYDLLNKVYSYDIEIPSDALLRAGKSLMRENKLSQAKECFQYSVKQSPRQPLGYYFLSDICMKQNDQESAKVYIDKAISLINDNKEQYSEFFQLREEIYK